MEKNQTDNFSQADNERIKQAISRWNQFLFSKDSDKKLFDYFLESTQKSQLINQYSTVFLEQCILWSLKKIETTPMQQNMRLKQSFQFIFDHAVEFTPTNETLTQLYEQSVDFKKVSSNNSPSNSFNYPYSSSSFDSFAYFKRLGSFKVNKDNDIVKYILEKVLEKTNLETTLTHFLASNEVLLKDISPIVANALIQKITNEPSLSDDLVLSLYYMEDKKKQLALLDSILLSNTITYSTTLKECWDIYSDKEKDILISKSIMSEVQNTALENLSGYREYVKNNLDLDLSHQKIIAYSKSINNKKKIELYFSLLEELYNESTPEKQETIKEYTRELYIKIIREKRPDLTKGLISVKAEKGIIQAEDVPLLVYHVMLNFPKLMGYHLINELLQTVKKIGKIKEFSDVFNTEKTFEIGRHRFQFDQSMKEEIKYIHYHVLSDILTEAKKDSETKPIKRLKI